MTTTLPTDVRGLFMGSGSGLAEPGMAEFVIGLTGRDAQELEVLYLGTATYDRPEPRERQAARFAALGCSLRELDVARRDPSTDELDEAIGRADVVLVSGGNTLYAVDRWVATGLDRRLRAAIGRGVVACGGSAGAICWFDGGHSDSMDPATYLDPVPADDARVTDWRYVRVPGLGLLPGLLCPHFDVTQSNGVLRATDFEAMMLRHPGEVGLGLDDGAGLLVDGATYRLVHAQGRLGSDGREGLVADEAGRPGLWIHEVRDGVVATWPAPRAGRLVEILRPARRIVADPRLAAARAENPAQLG